MALAIVTQDRKLDPNGPATPDNGLFGCQIPRDKAQIVLIPVPFEATTSYGGGTSKAPQAIVRASSQVDLMDIPFGKPYLQGISMEEEDSQVREWNFIAKSLVRSIVDDEKNPQNPKSIERVNQIGQSLNEWVFEGVSKYLKQGKSVGIIGGDHSVSYGSILAHAIRYPNMGILQIDAHCDLRTSFQGFEWSHASIMHNVFERIPQVSKIVQVGIRDVCEEEFEKIAKATDKICTFWDYTLKKKQAKGERWVDIVHEICFQLPEDIYISFDIDGLTQSLCPHTGTPVPGGLSFWEAVLLLEGIITSGKKIVGFDLVEVATSPLAEDEWDANVAARILYKMIGAMMVSQSKIPRILE